jgi:hypothetical protein
MDTLTELRHIIALYSNQIDLNQQELLEIIAIESFKLGANAGRVHEKAETNNKLAKLGVN